MKKCAGQLVLVASLGLPVTALADGGAIGLPPRFDLAACEADVQRNWLECVESVHYTAYHDCLAELRGWGHPTYFHEYCERVRDTYYVHVCYNPAIYESLLCRWFAGGRVGAPPAQPPEFEWPTPPSLPQPALPPTSTPPNEYVPAPPPGEEPPAAVAPALPPPVAPAPPPPVAPPPPAPVAP